MVSEWLTSSLSTRVQDIRREHYSGRAPLQPLALLSVVRLCVSDLGDGGEAA